MKTLPITNSDKVVVFDDEYYEEFSKIKWNISHGYAVRGYREDGKRKSVAMHTIVNQTPKGMLTDHIDGNRLDNRKENLRSCTRSENAMNRGKTITNKTGYKGVQYDKRDNRYYARIGVNGKQVYLGRFGTPEEAAEAYNQAVEVYHGEFAKSN